MIGEAVEAVLDAALNNDEETSNFLAAILLWIGVIPFMCLLPFMKIPKDWP